MKQETRAYCKALANIILALIGAVVLITVVPRVLSFFMPFVVAWIIALLASPMVKFLEDKLRIKRKAGTACVIIAVIALIILIGYGIAAFLIEKETITGKEFMEIFHEVEGINPEDKKEKSEERIAMNPVETEEDVSEEDVSEENI